MLCNIENKISCKQSMVNIIQYEHSFWQFLIIWLHVMMCLAEMGQGIVAVAALY